MSEQCFTPLSNLSWLHAHFTGGWGGEQVRIQSWTVKLKTVILAYQGWSWADGAKSWAAWFWQNRTVQSRDHKYKHFIMIHNGNLLYVKHIYKIKCSFLLYYYQFLNTHIRTDKFRKFRLSYNLEIPTKQLGKKTLSYS